jgi:acetyltransferase-like isoleucine patch superfamily enzyme
MKIIIRKLSIIVRRLKYLFRNYYYKSIFDVGDNTVFLGKVFFYHPHLIKIGNGCSINEGVFFNAGTSIIIGNNVAISAGVFITSVGGKTGPSEIVEGKMPHHYGVVEIGEGSWLGANSIILNGVEIGKNCRISAGSVVNSNVKDNTVVVGNPARPSSIVR